jgi:hypothetical protein
MMEVSGPGLDMREEMDTQKYEEDTFKGKDKR